MRKIIIGFSTPKNFKLGSSIIRLFERSKYSHIYIKMTPSPNSKLPFSKIFQASHGDVNAMTFDRFLEGNKIVHEYVLEVTDDKYFSFRAAILVILLGFAIRLFCFQYTYIVNPDGVLYIHQARAIYYGLWDSVLGCSLGFLSNYSILIVGFYKIFGDWVVAAKSVSFIFGSVTLILLYLLLGRFFNNNITFELFFYIFNRILDILKFLFL